MRMGGAFTLQVTDVQNGGPAIALAPGEAFYLGGVAGSAVNADIWLGQVTVLQIWDGLQQQWRTCAQPGTGPIDFDGDGYNWRIINLSGVVVGASITNAGSGATNGIGSAATGVTVAFGSPASPGVTATGYPIVGGQVVAPTVSQAGTGFLVPPLVAIDPPPAGGIQATAYATLVSPGGGIASITMLNPGAGYVATNPGFYLIPQTAQYQGGPAGGSSIAAGSIIPGGQVNVLSALPSASAQSGLSFTGTNGALLNPATLTGSGTLTGIVMVSYGSLYTGATIPAIAITGCGAAAATALMSMSMTGVSGISGGSGYGAGATPIWESSLGLIASSVGNLVYQPRAARGVTTVTGGAVSAFGIEDPGFGFQKVPQLAVINTSAIASGIATATAVVGGINDTVLIQTRIGS